MASTVILVVDIIGSKEVASQPGGHVAIHNLCQGMRDFLDTELQQLNRDGALEITLQKPQGDDIEYLFRGASFQNVADASVAAVIAAFSSGPSGKRFRYVVYSSADINYQPRIKVFADISKTEEGKKHHIAVERGVVSALANQEIITWLESATRLTISLDLIGEPWTGVYVDLYCRVSGNRDTDKQVSIVNGLPLKVYPPGGPVPVDAAHYIERDADDQTLEALRVMPFTMLVRGPVQCGKSSVLARLEQKAREVGVETAWFDPRTFFAQTAKATEYEREINAAAVVSLSELLQADWGLAPPRDGAIDSLPRAINWLIRGLASTAPKPRLLVFDDLASLGVRATEDWLSLFVRAMHNKRATGGPNVSMAVGITNCFGPHFSRKLTELSSIVNWWPRIELSWFNNAEVGKLATTLQSARPEAQEIFDLFAGQPYLTHAAVADKNFGESTRRWIEDRSEFNARHLRESQIYRRHLNAIRRSILGPTLEANAETRKLLQAFISVCAGQLLANTDQELFLKTQKLLGESGDAALSMYHLVARDMIEAVRR